MDGHTARRKYKAIILKEIPSPNRQNADFGSLSLSLSSNHPIQPPHFSEVFELGERTISPILYAYSITIC